MEVGVIYTYEARERDGFSFIYYRISAVIARLKELSDGRKVV